MDIKGVIDKAKSALKGNPSLVDKGGDAIDKATGGKYAGHVDKAQDAVKKAVGAQDQQPQQGQQGQQGQPQQGQQQPPQQ